MIKRIAILIILICTIIFAYEIYKSKHKKSNPKSNFGIFVLKDKLVDSLVKFSSLNEFLLRDDNGKFVLYSSEINNTKIGFIAVTDSMLYFYQKFKNKWVLNDSITFKTYALSYKVVDLNGDNKNDFIINSFNDVHGQSIPYVFMCNNENTLKYRKDIKLYNMKYDSNRELVRSSYESCAYCIHSKELYRWVNDSLKLIERVELDLSNENRVYTKYYKVINKKIVNYKTINNDTEYEKALWIDECE